MGLTHSPSGDIEEAIMETIPDLLQRLEARPRGYDEALRFIREYGLPMKYVFLLTRDCALFDTLGATVSLFLVNGIGIRPKWCKLMSALSQCRQSQ